MKYPIGIQSFDRLREEGFVYVDKTELLYKLVSNGSIYFFSRPRRFGKSLLISTLSCYFEGRRELFKGLAIEQLEKEWLKYPVFRIDFSKGHFLRAGELEEQIEEYISKWEQQYGKDPLELTTSGRFHGVLQRAYRQTGHRAVVLVDEYDKPLLDVLDSETYTQRETGEKLLLEDHHREILKDLYSTFKGADASLRFVMLTGVTKFSQVSVFSGFNQPDDISMDERYEALCGITQEELENCFAEPIAELARKRKVTGEEMKQLLKRRYDGYHFGTALIDIYNPFSLLNVFNKMRMGDYWFASGTPTYLVRLLQHSREQMNELTGKYYNAAMFVDYKADVEQPLPMIYQSGYLTIKDYDEDMETFLLDFPNNEVRRGFLTALAAGYLKPKGQEAGTWTTEAVTYLRRGDTDAFFRSLTAFLASIPYDSHPSLKDIAVCEKHFQYTFYLLLRLMGVYCNAIRCEDRQSYGRVDCTLEMTDYVYIFEFKMDGTADEALEQIRTNGYAKPYLTDKRKVMCIGVNFSSATRNVEEWKALCSRS